MKSEIDNKRYGRKKMKGIEGESTYFGMEWERKNNLPGCYDLANVIKPQVNILYEIILKVNVV